MIKAFIFDMDGVIADSEPLHIAAEKAVMKSFGVKISTHKLHSYTGVTSKFMFDDLIKTYHLPVTFDQMFQAKEKIYFKLLQTKLKPISGVITFLHHLQKRGYLLAVASSSDRKYVTYILQKLGIFPLFKAIVTGNDVKKGKPDPEIFLKAAKLLKVKPSACVVIEDASYGVTAAKKAGMTCFGFISKNSGLQDLSQADRIFSSFRQLKKSVCHS